MDPELKAFLEGMEGRLIDRLDQKMDEGLQRVRLQLVETMDAKLQDMEQRFHGTLQEFASQILDQVNVKTNQLLKEVNQVSRDLRDVKERLEHIEGMVLRHEKILDIHTHKIAVIEQEMEIARR
ncbi:MAG: hypothetical protein K6T63_11405 [Alicyclobacillus herbarius]|uniref:hypothetical protein n=1 Tax=Alicyclobacillus herbarius TaxID=122960 RepID=UPI00235701B5|nr:hypothetical protein [Alicyclobacillus herbarius]MCL6633224.1 hypothetical protein [Alicyclobacillus herbarius]